MSNDPCPHALGMAKVPAKRWTTRADLYDRLTQARNILDEPSDEPPSLEEAAEAASLSKHHFLRLFRDSFGHTPGQYLARRRIGVAKQYLTETSLTVTEIAMKVGCQTPSSFSKLFSQATGMSPTAWRRSQSS